LNEAGWIEEGASGRMDLADRVVLRPARFSFLWRGVVVWRDGWWGRARPFVGRGGALICREDRGADRRRPERLTEDALAGFAVVSGARHVGGPRAERVGARRAEGACNSAHMGVAHFGQGRGGKGGRDGLSRGGRGNAWMKASCA